MSNSVKVSRAFQDLVEYDLELNMLCSFDLI